MLDYQFINLTNFQLYGLTLFSIKTQTRLANDSFEKFCKVKKLGK